jgi:predicted aspartyl protease
MGLAVLRLGVSNVERPEEMRQVELLVDSGAFYSVVPAATLDELGIKPFATHEFGLADGRKISRGEGGALFRFQDRVGVADVIFGERGDCNLLGALTLAALGLALDPLRRELHLLPMILAGSRSESSSTERDA